MFSLGLVFMSHFLWGGTFTPDFPTKINIPSGKRLHNYGKSPCYELGKSTISMAIFNNKLLVYQRVCEWDFAMTYSDFITGLTLW